MVVMSNSHFSSIHDELVTVTGGAGRAAARDPNQAELRQMAAQHCPVTYAANKNARTLTRAMGERCLDEAGYGWAKGRLDKYFPPTRR
jgi:hypothetical protein